MPTFLDLTLPTIEENLALDEALLDRAERADENWECLRLWESPSTAVVVGCSSQMDQEVDVASCQGRGWPVLRRVSGGAAVVVGPGCLMYSVVFSYALHPHARMLDQAHCLVLSRLRDALGPLVGDVRICGTSDLALRDPALGERKFSGNSLRCRRTHFLYHGTLLYAFPLERIAAALKMPPRQPDYRGRREHGAFVQNLPISAAQLRAAVERAFEVDSSSRVASLDEATTRDVRRLVAERYSRDDWNLRR